MSSITITKENNSNIQSYLNIIEKNQLLTIEEERQLTSDLKSHKNNNNSTEYHKVKDILILKNLRLILNLAKKYAQSNDQFSDLIQESIVGLIKSVDKFNPDLGYRFSTYTTWWIKQAIFNYLNSHDKSLQLPGSMQKLLHRKKKMHEALQIELKREPSLDEVMEALDIEIHSKQYYKLVYIEENCLQLTSLDTPITQADSNAEVASILDTIQDESAVSVDMALEQHTLKEVLFNILHNDLSTREYYIVEQRFGLNNSESKSLKAISEELKISLERVRQIEKISLSKIKQLMNA